MTGLISTNINEHVPSPKVLNVMKALLLLDSFSVFCFSGGFCFFALGFIYFGVFAINIIYSITFVCYSYLFACHQLIVFVINALAQTLSFGENKKRNRLLSENSRHRRKEKSFYIDPFRWTKAEIVCGNRSDW